jgi:exosortase/archaeosortase family protein
VPAWLLLAGAVGLTSFLTFFPLRLLCSWAWRCRTKVLLAAGLGGCLALVTPWAQGLWPRVAGPTLAMDRALLARTYGHGITGQTWEGVPVVGTKRLLLLVTPGCSEMDAMAAFWLLAAAVLCARWREVRKVRLALALLLGTALLYLLNAARIYGLVVVGTSLSPKVAVSLAHSRIGGGLFLGVAAALLSLILRPRLGQAPPAGGPSRAG